MFAHFFFCLPICEETNAMLVYTSNQKYYAQTVKSHSISNSMKWCFYAQIWFENIQRTRQRYSKQITHNNKHTTLKVITTKHTEQFTSWKVLSFGQFCNISQELVLSDLDTVSGWKPFFGTIWYNPFSLFHF